MKSASCAENAFSKFSTHTACAVSGYTLYQRVCHSSRKTCQQKHLLFLVLTCLLQPICGHETSIYFQAQAQMNVLLIRKIYVPCSRTPAVIVRWFIMYPTRAQSASSYKLESLYWIYVYEVHGELRTVGHLFATFLQHHGSLSFPKTHR